VSADGGGAENGAAGGARGATDVSGRSAPDLMRGGMPSAASAKDSGSVPKPLLLIVSGLGLACAVAAVLLFLRRRSGDTPVPGGSTPTPRP
jgi:hypothetical protein